MSGILHLGFNQSVTHITCCTEMGDMIFSLNSSKGLPGAPEGPVPNLEKQLNNKRNGGVGIMRMYNETNIMFLVGGGASPFISKDMFVMWDDMRKQIIYEVSMNATIRNIRAVGDKLFVSLDKKLDIFNFKPMLLVNSKMTYQNPEGLCVISNVNSNVATLGPSKGEVSIWKPNMPNETSKVISAHSSNIEALAINNDGTLVATASETATVIKIFDTETGALKYQLRRGLMTVKIHDIAFNKNSTLLACCSANGTVHIFDLYDNKEKTKNTQSYLVNFSDYLPGYFSSEWGFKQIPSGMTGKMICAFDAKNNLHIASYEGKYMRLSGDDYDKKYESIIDINNN